MSAGTDERAMAKDFYSTLGVERGASADEIKKAYRQLAMKYHPDRNPGDQAAEERFKDVSEAYAVLSDPDKRKHFDSFGSEQFGQRFSTEDILRDFNIDDILSQFGMKSSGWGGFSFRRGGGGASGGPGMGGAGSIFDMFGGGGGGPRQPMERPPVGSNAEVPLEVSFYEAMHGSERGLQVRIDGEQRDLSVRIPPGIRSGKKLRVKGKGHSGPGGPGDLLLIVRVSADDRFERQDDDLHTNAQVLPSDLLLGGTVTVETLTGERRLKVQAGTASGTRLRIRGAGAPVLGKGERRGDLYVRLEVTPPAELDESQRAAAEALRESGL